MTVWRYIAQRVRTNTFLDFDLPLSDVSVEWALSGPGALTATLTPDTGALRAPDGRPLLEEWGTFLYAEADGEIRWGGVVVSSKFNDESWSIEAAGLSTFPHTYPYDRDYAGVLVDPADVFREVWRAVQGRSNSNLGVYVPPDATPVRLGRLAYLEYDDGHISSLSYLDPTYVPQGAKVVEAKPYALDWYDYNDCGQELDKLAQETPFDYVEKHFWVPDVYKTPVDSIDRDLASWMRANGWTTPAGEPNALYAPTSNPQPRVAHVVRVNYPRAGRRRDDLAFIQGDNVVEVVTPEIDGDDYANVIYGVGAGEGAFAVRAIAEIDDGRLRRPYVYTDKSIRDPARLQSLVNAELQRRKNALTISSITVRNHPNALIGSWALGDDITVEAQLPWLGDFSLDCRIVGWSLIGDDTATLTLRRSDEFRYGGSA